MIPQSLIGREEEQLVLSNRPSKASAELAKLLIHARHWGFVEPAVLVVSIQAGSIVFEEAAEVKLIGPALGEHLDLRAGVAPIFSRERRGDDGYFADGLLIGSDDRRATVVKAVRTDSVDQISVGLYAAAVRADLYLVLRLEDRTI